MKRRKRAEPAGRVRYRHWRDSVVLTPEGVGVRDHRGSMLIPWDLITDVQAVLRPSVERREIRVELCDGTLHVLPAPIERRHGEDPGFAHALTRISRLQRELGRPAPDRPEDEVPLEFRNARARDVVFRARGGLWHGGGFFALLAGAASYVATLVWQMCQAAQNEGADGYSPSSSDHYNTVVYIMPWVCVSALCVAAAVRQRVKLRRARRRPA